jgi:hypothetical protein
MMSATTLRALVHREWLQHRLGWSLVLALPPLLALAVLVFGRIEVASPDFQGSPLDAATLAALISLAGAMTVSFVFMVITALLMMSGLPRRDHGDRSVEFWTSLPVGHAPALAVPMLTHLLLAPLAALALGLAAGLVISLAAVWRVADLGTWFTLPWGALVTGVGAIGLRLAAGLPLALLWLSPLLLAVMLMTAWFRRWGIVLLVVGLGLGSWLLERWFGAPLLSQLVSGWLQGAGHALVTGGQMNIGPKDGVESLGALPLAALQDFGRALAALASPLLALGLALAAAFFALLVDWRRRAVA